MITLEQLCAACQCKPSRAQRWLQALNGAMAAYDITEPVRAAAFLAQVGHESMSLATAVEIWGPLPSQSGYEGRKDLGNTQIGDGFRFRGRGLLQTTGRFNYAALRDALRASDPDTPDFEANPDLLAEPEWAALSAAHYWASHGCNELADIGDFERITRKINGGLNGLSQRQALWEGAKEAFA